MNYTDRLQRYAPVEDTGDDAAADIPIINGTPNDGITDPTTLAKTKHARRFTLDFNTLEIKTLAARAAAENHVTLGSLITCAVYEFLIQLDPDRYTAEEPPKLISEWRIGQKRPRKGLPKLGVVYEKRKEEFNRKRSGAPNELPGWEQIVEIIDKAGGGMLPVGEWRFILPNEVDVLFKKSQDPHLLRAVYTDELGNIFDREFAHWRWYTETTGAWETPADKGRLIYEAVMSGRWYPKNAYWEGWSAVENGTYLAKQCYDVKGQLRSELRTPGMTLTRLFQQSQTKRHEIEELFIQPAVTVSSLTTEEIQ